MTGINAVMLAIAFAVAMLDGVLKFLAHRLPKSIAENGLITFGFHKNPGIAFNIPVPLSIALLVTAIVIALLAFFIYRNRRRNSAASIAASMVIIGAVGNAIDRALNNYTTDYLIFVTRSAINLSDVLIVIGTCAFLYYTRDRSPADAEY